MRSLREREGTVLKLSRRARGAQEEVSDNANVAIGGGSEGRG